MRHRFILIICLLGLASWSLYGQQDHADHEGDHSGTEMTHQADGHADNGHEAEGDHGEEGHDGHGGEYDPTGVAFHHVSDQNIYSIGPWAIPLPCILYAPEEGWTVMSSSVFEVGHHGIGHKSYNKYVLYEGMVRRIVDPSFPSEQVAVDLHHRQVTGEDGKESEEVYAVYNGKEYVADAKSTMDGGLLGGGITSFYDFSVTKNVVSMLLMLLFMGWIFFKIARAYREREGMAPKGIQSFMEPIFLFIQDEVAKPFLGHKWKQYLPFLLSLFFFILSLNLFGQIPFLGSANATGNLSVTMALAIFTFLVVNLSGNWHYWQHVIWMPGAPAPIKLLVLTPVEIMGLFIKPLTLMLRLFANITAGHMVILSFIGLIFIFGQSGENIPGTMVGTVMAVPLTLFMMAIELLVAFVQAFVFTILTASYIGAAVEEHHH